MNSIQAKTPATIIRTINIIHLALIAGQALFALVAFTNSQQTTVKFDEHDQFTFIIPGFAIASFLISNFLFKTLIAKAVNLPDLLSKLTGYQTALIVRMAALEAISLFAIVTYILTSNFLFLLISVILMVYGVIIRPTVDKIADDLQLSYDEKMQLQHYILNCYL
ncbi:hypothetical protein ACFQZS_04550 [Mucilaginibacter calamicampi]|uniref:Uncharacterized protein n=1 Tax=Mucilaginibacter calamicampi TaxID=1302352 RepID=A0ABW2YSJ8_9SPHI